MNELNEEEHEKWGPCPPGVIHVTAAQPTLARRRMIKLLGTGAVFSVITGVTSYSMISSNSSKKRNSSLPGGIGCVQVIDNLVAYVGGTIEECSLKNEITLHLMKCSKCFRRYQALCASSQHGSKKGCRGRSKLSIKPFK